jgi:hypothetical protein
VTLWTAQPKVAVSIELTPSTAVIWAVTPLPVDADHTGVSGVIGRPVATGRRRRPMVLGCTEGPPGVGNCGESGQAFGRLPWFAPFFFRDFRLRPRLLMRFSVADVAAGDSG